MIKYTDKEIEHIKKLAKAEGINEGRITGVIITFLMIGVSLFIVNYLGLVK